MAGPQIGYGATFEWDGDPVLQLTRIGPVSLTIAKQDATTLGSANSFKEMLPGLIDPGDLEIEGLFKPSDTGQIGMYNDMLTRTVKGWVIAFPTAISTSTWTGNGYVTSFVAGDATPEGIVPFSATISITGKPVLGVTQAGVATDILITGDVSGALTEIPTFAGTTYIYSVDTNLENTFTVTVTAAAATTITMNVDGGADIALTTGVASGNQNTSNGAIVTVVIRVQETDKSDRTYTLRCVDGV
jgi:hypothetical protein